MSLHYLVKSQRFIDRVIGQWRRLLECVVQQQGGHIERTFEVKLQDVSYFFSSIPKPLWNRNSDHLWLAYHISYSVCWLPWDLGLFFIDCKVPMLFWSERVSGVSHWNNQSRAITNAHVTQAGFKRWFLALVHWCRYFSSRVYHANWHQKSVMFTAVTVTKLYKRGIHCIIVSIPMSYECTLVIRPYCPVNDQWPVNGPLCGFSGIVNFLDVVRFCQHV